MKKIFVLGMLVGIVSVCGARAELIETVTATESGVVSVDNPVVVEETEVDEFEDIVPEPEPESEPIEEYPVPTEEIPD